MLIYPYDKWDRYGRGRGIDFFATDEELYEFLDKTLPKEFEPYTLVWSKPIKEGRDYQYEQNENELTQFIELRSQGLWMFFIRSKVLTPEIFQATTALPDGAWGLNGLINIQQGRKSKKGLEFSSISLVDKIQNVETGEIVTHDEYLAIFNKLKKTLRKQLRYTSKKKRPDGTIEESKTILMTKGYAEFCRAHPEESSVMVGEPC